MNGTLIVFEKKPWWLPELQRQFLVEDVRIRSCSRLQDLPQLTKPNSSMPVSPPVVILNLDDQPANCLQFLGQYASRPTWDCPVLVIASTAFRELELPIRELGATEFLLKPLAGDRLGQWCRRQLRASTNSPPIETKFPR
ncbi:response regulator [Thalassoroseus pseudoceratinae]|uniref:hypothetical protein n=1 Tax=Thalassoroseus pseudoceratinae TaxID=2713176 RepID=UPI001420A068|nr:hypothetical protein [Thalassoroseus pseudoceratinae]